MGILLFLLNTFLWAGDYTPETLPDPKQYSVANWVSNPDQILNKNEAQQINSQLEGFSVAGLGQFVVVVVNQISSDFTPKQFATQLFKKWGVGVKGSDKGLLLLVVVSQKRWEFETGYGFEGDLPDVLLSRMGHSILDPNFKEGNYFLGLSLVIQEIGKKLAGQPIGGEPQPVMPVARDVLNQPVESSLTFKELMALVLGLGLLFSLGAYSLSRKPSFFRDKTQMQAAKNGLQLYIFFLVCGLVLLLIAFPFGILIFTLILSFFAVQNIIFLFHLLGQNFKSSTASQTQEKMNIIQRFNDQAKGAIFFGAGFHFIKILGFMINRVRFQDRPCLHCQAPLKKDYLVAAHERDQYLNPKQIIEQKLKSVAYDVWKCAACKKPSIFSFSLDTPDIINCEPCASKTLRYKHYTFLAAPTLQATGTGERVYECQICQDIKRVAFVIPRLTNRSNYDRYRNYGSSNKPGSSGSGWGGGRSGGGGAGGNW